MTKRADSGNPRIDPSCLNARLQPTARDRAAVGCKPMLARDIIVNSAFHRTRAHAFYERLGYAGTGLRMVKTLA